MSSNVLKTYIPPNRKLISKEVLDVIHEQNMKRNLAMIKKEDDIFGLLFLVDGATISRCPLLNILASTKYIPVDALKIIDCHVHLAQGYKKDATFICNLFLKHMKVIDPGKKLTGKIMFNGASNV